MTYYPVLGLLAQEELAYYVLLVELSGFSRTWLANVLSESLHQLELLSSLESIIANGSVEDDHCQARGEIVQLDRSMLRQE